MNLLIEIKNELLKEPYTDIHRKKMKIEDWDIIDKFLDSTEKEHPHERILKINRLFIDNNNKPKNWILISEFLTFINSRHLRRI